MCLALLKKDLTFLFRKDNNQKGLWSLIGTLFSNIVLIVFISAIFYFVLIKVSNISNGTNELLGNAGTSLFILVLFFMSLIYIFTYTSKMINLIYQDDDKFLIRPLPIKTKDIVFSKIISIYFKLFSEYGWFLIGFFIVYGIIYHCGPGFFILNIFMSFIYPFFILFFSSLLSRPLRQFFVFCKNKSYLSIILSVIVALIVGIIYFYIIIGIIKIISNKEINSIFSITNLNILSNLVYFAFPINGFFTLSLGKPDIFLLILSLVFLSLSIILTFIVINRNFLRFRSEDQKSLKFLNNNKEFRFYSFPFLFKEIKRIIRSTDKIFGFFSLIVLVPFFSYLFGNLVNEVFIAFDLDSIKDIDMLVNTGIDYALAVIIANIPYYKVILSFSLLTLFTALLYSPGDDLFEGEKNSFKTIITLPKSLEKQVGNKISQGVFFSFLSILISSIILGLTGIFTRWITLMYFFFCLFFTWAGYLYSEANGIERIGEEKESTLAVIFILLASVVSIVIYVLLFNAFNFKNETKVFLVLAIEIVIGIALLGYSIFNISHSIKRFRRRILEDGVTEYL